MLDRSNTRCIQISAEGGAQSFNKPPHTAMGLSWVRILLVFGLVTMAMVSVVTGKRKVSVGFFLHDFVKIFFMHNFSFKKAWSR